MIQQTSILSYQDLREENLGERQLMVLKGFREHGEHTDLEMIKILDLFDANMLRPRRNELVRMGLIEEKTRRTCLISKRKAIVWGIVNE